MSNTDFEKLLQAKLQGFELPIKEGSFDATYKSMMEHDFESQLQNKLDVYELPVSISSFNAIIDKVQMNEFETSLQDKAEQFMLDPATGSFDKVFSKLPTSKSNRRKWGWYLSSLFILLFIPTCLYFYNEILKHKAEVYANSKSLVNNSIVENHTKLNTPVLENKITIPVINNSSESNSNNLIVNENDADIKSIPDEKLVMSNLANSTSKNPNLDQNDIATLSENSTIDLTNNTHSKDKTTANINTTNSETNTISEPKNNNVINTHLSENASSNVVDVVSVNENTNTSYINTQSEKISLLTLRPFKVEKTFKIKPAEIKLPKIKTPPSLDFLIGAYSQFGGARSVYSPIYSNIIAENLTEIRAAEDITIFSYNAGLKGKLLFNKSFSISLGLGYNYYESNQVVYSLDPNSGSSVNVDPNTSFEYFNFITDSSIYANSIQENFKNQFGFIHLPFSFGYEKSWKRFGFSAEAGFSIDMFVKNRSLSADNANYAVTKTNTVEHSKVNRLGLNGHLNLNLLIHFNRFTLNAGPVFRYRFNPLYRDGYIYEQRPYFIGAEVGLMYRL